MSRTVYWDPFSGLAGDMMIGALLALGAPWEAVEDAVLAMNVEGLEVSRESVLRGGIQAIKFKVAWVTKEHPVHRHLPEILEMVDKAHMEPGAAHRAHRAFQALAEAEARIHGSTLEEVQLHEVGAEDSIADIVGACAAYDALGVTGCWVGPITTGTGWTRGAHGRIPVPAPATLELLRGFRVLYGETQAELTTPTGAALMHGLSAGSVDAMPCGIVEAVGYGAGTWELDTPNVTRAILLKHESNSSGGKLTCRNRDPRLA